MDLSFVRSDPWRSATAPARLDHQRLLVSLVATQAASATARTESLIAARAPRLTCATDALALLLAGGAGWTNALGLLGGSFHPAAAARASSARQGT